MNLDLDPTVSWIAVALILGFVYLLRKLVYAMKEVEMELNRVNRDLWRDLWRLIDNDSRKSKKRKTHLSNAGMRLLHKRSFQRVKGHR